MFKNKIKNELETLNSQQRKAVMHQGGPLFVVAGAGTGKTKTLTTRIAYLITHLNVNPNNILGVTFTNKAASEIRSRINNMIEPMVMGSWLHTFHAFGLRILRSHANSLGIGYQNDFMVIDEDDKQTLLRDIIKNNNFDAKEYTPRKMANFISNHKTLIMPINDANIEKIYEKYQAELIKEQLMDFDDLIVYPHQLFKTNKTILSIYQNQFEHILIDEFQDTDKIQYEIIKMLNNPNTFVVGDPDQSIYSFRGARYENNELFLKDFNAETIVLDENYRSTNNILKVANKLISKNESRTTEKKLVSSLGDGAQVKMFVAEDDKQEVSYVTSEIFSLIQKGYQYEDIAILYRNNALSRLFEHSFMQYQIPYIIYGGTSFYERKEVKDMLAYIKVIVDPKSNFYLKRIINVPTRGIGNVTIKKLEEYALINNMSMFEAIDYINLSKRALDNLKGFKQLIINLQNEILKLEELKEAVDLIFHETKYYELLNDDIPEKASERKQNINELKSVIQSNANETIDNNLLKLKNILDEIALYTDQDKNIETTNVVKLATVHQVKGLEFKVVFVVAMEENIFPNDRAYESQSDIEEERRIFYVALTRPKEQLYITHAQRRLLYGNIRYNEPSIFLNEIREVDKPKENPHYKSNNKLEVNNLTTGDIIMHDIFGKGVVVSINDDIATIAFGIEYGIKKLLKDHPSIKKVD